MMDGRLRRGIAFAVLAAALYAINAPFSKLMLAYMPPVLMAGFLYIGAGVGMLLLALIRRLRRTEPRESGLTRAELPYTMAMIALDIAAPICLMVGLNATTAANASLLNNFEIVATAVIALVLFREKISARLWLGIFFVVLSCGILSFEDASSLQFSYGSVFVLLAATCWGFENNCTRKISAKDPLQIVLLKGIFSGTGALVIGLCTGERITAAWSVAAVLVIGFVAYGLSIYFYVYAQRLLGAARTSAYYAVAPFISAILSLLMFRQLPDGAYFAALAAMAVGAWLSSQDKPLVNPRRPAKRPSPLYSKTAPYFSVRNGGISMKGGKINMWKYSLIGIGVVIVEWLFLSLFPHWFNGMGETAGMIAGVGFFLAFELVICTGAIITKINAKGEQ